MGEFTLVIIVSIPREWPQVIEPHSVVVSFADEEPLVVLALNTGARQGELLDLTVEDVDPIRRLIYFGRTKNKRLKVVPMNDAVREVVGELKRDRPAVF